jgi:hypothetical protein
MDPKELRGLYEAYAEVYVPQEVDEAVKGASRHDTEMRKAASTERKAGIKNRLSPAAGKDNADKMQRDVKFFDKLTKKNRNVVGLVTKEDFDIFDTVLEFLQVEGYAETLEKAQWMMANVIDEEAIDIILGEEQLDELSVNKMLAYVEKGEKNRADLNKKWDKGTASYREKMRVLGREEGEARASDKVEKKTGKRPYEMNALDKARYAVTKEEVEGLDEVSKELAGRVVNARIAKTGAAFDREMKDRTPENMRDTMDAAGKEGRAKRLAAGVRTRRNATNEEYMDEAQEARNNPEKYEREQSKKSAPVRGEKTPMPPRGDKRREDFEKWYAANVR